jgi:hypothetical protein
LKDFINYFFEIYIYIYIYNHDGSKKWWESKSLLFQVNLPLHSTYPIIDNISLPHNLAENYVSLFLQKKILNVVEGLIMLECWNPKNLSKKNYLYLLLKICNFKNYWNAFGIFFWHYNVEPKKVTLYWIKFVQFTRALHCYTLQVTITWSIDEKNWISTPLNSIQ